MYESKMIKPHRVGSNICLRIPSSSGLSKNWKVFKAMRPRASTTMVHLLYEDLATEEVISVFKIDVLGSAFHDPI